MEANTAKGRLIVSYNVYASSTRSINFKSVRDAVAQPPKMLAVQRVCTNNEYDFLILVSMQKKTELRNMRPHVLINYHIRKMTRFSSIFSGAGELEMLC